MPEEEVEEAEEAGVLEEDLEVDLDIVAVDGKGGPEVVVTVMEGQGTTRDLMVVHHTEEAMVVTADEELQVQVDLDLVR